MVHKIKGKYRVIGRWKSLIIIGLSGKEKWQEIRNRRIWGLMRVWVLHRYNFKFQERNCNNEVSLICIHHIDGNKENNDFSNLIPLCHSCHRYTHWCGLKCKEIKDFKTLLYLEVFG